MAGEDLGQEVRDAVARATAASETLKKSSVNFSKTSSQNTAVLQQGIDKVTVSVRVLGQTFQTAKTHADNLLRAIGIAGIGGAFTMISRGLENMSRSAVNLHYTAR